MDFFCRRGWFDLLDIDDFWILNLSFVDWIILRSEGEYNISVGLVNNERKMNLSWLLVLCLVLSKLKLYVSYKRVIIRIYNKKIDKGREDLFFWFFKFISKVRC